VLAVRFWVLGPLEVTSGESPCHLRRGRPRSLLHLLLLHRRVVLPTEVVADRLWQEPPQDAPNAVHQLVSYTRRALRDTGDILVTAPTGYLLQAEDDAVDAWRFDHLVQSATELVRRGDGATAASEAMHHAEEALDMWRGKPFIESSDYEWAQGDISRLEDSYLLAQETRLEAMLQLGRHREVVLEAQALVAAHPLREQFHLQYSLALYRSERQGEALEVHRALRDLLANELGIDPSPRLQQLEQRLLQQDPGLLWRAPTDLADVSIRPTPTPSPSDVGAPEPVRRPPLHPARPPRPASPLIGRERDVLRVLELLAPGFPVTITGSPGVGKSRIAVEVSLRLDTSVWFVDLADVGQPEFVFPTLSQRLGLSGTGRGQPLDQIVSALAGERGVLVLDQCEHLLEPIVALVGTLREQAEELSVLITSRRPIGLESERIFPLPPLSVPGPHQTTPESVQESTAVQLFVQSIRRLRPDFELDSEAAEVIGDLARAVDGLPLAIELAAAHSDVVGLTAIRARLAEQLDYSTASSGNTRTLRAALDASVNLLSDDERSFLGSLSVFEGVFDLAAASEVCGDGSSETYPLLASLVRQSLVVREGEGGYRLLQPIRARAKELLSEDARADLQHRHARFVMAVADRVSSEIRGRGQQAALQRLHQLLPDARAAFESSMTHGDLACAASIAIGLSWSRTIEGITGEGLAWLERLRLRLSSEPPTPATQQLLANVLRSIGLVANPLGELRRARDACEQAADLYRASHDMLGLTATLLTQGIAEWAMGDFSKAAITHDEARQIAEENSLTWHRVVALSLRARTALDSGEADASHRIQEAVAAAQSEGEKQALGLALILLARLNLREGKPAVAEVVAEEALGHWRTIMYREGEISALNVLGHAKLALGHLEQAEDLFRDALVAAAGARHRGGMCEAVESLACVASANARHERALLLLETAAHERERLAVPLPGGGTDAVRHAREKSLTALDATAETITVRARIVAFDALVEQLLQTA
jgi:predicted ATPase/DNA-binding SARP family transcriptional activator